MTTTYLWVMAVFWLVALTEGLTDKYTRSNTLTTMRLVFLVWPLLCLAACGGGDPDDDDGTKTTQPPACQQQPERCK